MKNILTRRQKELLRIIYKCIKDTGFPPSFEEMKEELNVSSNQTIIDLLKQLQKKKAIKRLESAARGINILPAGYELLNKKQLLPNLGITSAGPFLTSFTDNFREWKELPGNIKQAKDDVFVLQINGDSMINAGLNHGDTVLVKKSNDYKSGDIVVVRNDDGTTIKRYIREKDGRFYLKPENPAYNIIPVYEEMVFEGKVLTNLSLVNTEPTKIFTEKIKQKNLNKKLTKYFKANDFVLYNEDSITALASFPENYFNMIFADPPYMLSNGGFTCKAGKMVSVNKGKWDESKGVEKDFEFHRQWIKACKRVLKPNGTIWISGTYHSIYSCGFALQLEGFKILNDICWYKPNASPNLSCRFFTASHETIIWARKEAKSKHTFNYDKMKGGNWHKDDFIKKADKQMRSVWAIGTPKIEEKKFGKHPTQKPLDLLKRIVLASTKEGDVILDPFTGSSTTGIAAVANGRKFVGIDTDKKYLDLSIKRYKDLSQKKQYRNLKLI